jgi:hypothetical protein
VRAVSFDFSVMRSLRARLPSFIYPFYPVMLKRPFLLALALCAAPAFQQAILNNRFYDGFRLPEYFASK